MPALPAKHISVSDSLSTKRRQPPMTIQALPYYVGVRAYRERRGEIPSPVPTNEHIEHPNYKWWDRERDGASDSSIHSPGDASLFSYDGSISTADSIMDEEGIVYYEGIPTCPKIDGVLPIRNKKNGDHSQSPIDPRPTTRRLSTFPSPDKPTHKSHRRYPSSPLSKCSEPDSKPVMSTDTLGDIILRRANASKLARMTLPEPMRYYSFDSTSENVGAPNCEHPSDNKRDLDIPSLEVSPQHSDEEKPPCEDTRVEDGSDKHHAAVTPLEELCGSFLTAEFGMNLHDFESPEVVTQAMEQLCSSLLHMASSSYKGLFQEYITYSTAHGVGESQSSQSHGRYLLNFVPGEASNSGTRNGQKRNSDHLDDSESVETDGGPRTPKQPRVDGEGLLCCPYRKRNPRRFNCRDHDCFKRGFKDMSELKKHIQKRHRGPLSRGPHPCLRCHESFKDINLYRDHIRQPVPCTIRQQEVQDPEDGITWEMDNSLAKRGARAVNTWPEIWKLLFPKDRIIPDSVFLPALEHFEVEEEFNKGCHQLASSIQQELTRPASPESDAFPPLATRIADKTRLYLGHVIENCYARISKGIMSEFTPPSLPLPVIGELNELQAQIPVEAPESQSNHRPVIRQPSNRSILTMDTGTSGHSSIYTPGSSNSTTSESATDLRTVSALPRPPPNVEPTLQHDTFTMPLPYQTQQPPPPQQQQQHQRQQSEFSLPAPPQNTYGVETQPLPPTNRQLSTNTTGSKFLANNTTRPQFMPTGMEGSWDYDEHESIYNGPHRDSGVEVTPPTSICEPSSGPGSLSLGGLFFPLLPGYKDDDDMAQIDAFAQDLGECNTVQMHNDLGLQAPFPIALDARSWRGLDDGGGGDLGDCSFF